ncbi:2-hydroxyacid dehydrogenase [Rhodanobacter aciditrophus]|uniref:2-hydroxyacid dehydrogenase n=1 Tax=Rhodanobacter aciditrophus TaxID=1623218 RepID=A0ABW4B470_9GAMM
MKAPIPFIHRLDEADERLWLEQLSRQMPDESILPLNKLSDAECKMADIAVVANPDPEDLKRLPNLVWVHSVWAGVERMVNELDNPAFRIVRLVDPELSNTMAEAVLTWSLFLHRDIPDYSLQQQKALWQPLPYVPARERTVGLLGLGELGKASAERLKSNGFNVIGWSRSQKTIAGVECFSGEEGFESVLNKSDILVCLLPLTQHTENLLSFESMDLIKPGAKLINFARGKIIDDEALLYALNTGRLQRAVLDVFAIEPLPRSHPYWTHPKVSVLPHISAATSIYSASQIVAQNVRNYRMLNILPNTVDLQLGY